MSHETRRAVVISEPGCPEVLAVREVAQPIVDRVFSLNEIRAAHERLESNQIFGKVVLNFAG